MSTGFGNLSEWLKKPWGMFREIHRDRRVVIVDAEIAAGGFSSIHKHQRKDNTFIVVSGELQIEMYPSSLRPDVHLLRPETGAMTVIAHVPHRFKALQETRLLEIYRCIDDGPIDDGGDDIIRLNEGGGIENLKSGSD